MKKQVLFLIMMLLPFITKSQNVNMYIEVGVTSDLRNIPVTLYVDNDVEIAGLQATFAIPDGLNKTSYVFDEEEERYFSISGRATKNHKKNSKEFFKASAPNDLSISIVSDNGSMIKGNSGDIGTFWFDGSSLADGTYIVKMYNACVFPDANSRIDAAGVHTPEQSADYKPFENVFQFVIADRTVRGDIISNNKILTIRCSGNGSATYNGNVVKEKSSSFSLEEGTKAVVIFAPDEGFKIKNVKLNGKDVTSEIINNQYTISNISIDTTLEVEFEPEIYVITYIVDGKIYKTDSVKCGSAITSLSSPNKEGYTFSGWNGLPKTMPAHDVTVTGTFVINSYVLTYTVDGKEYKRYTVTYGAAITPEADPTKEGYTFSGWSEIPKTMPAKDVTITGKFTINSYTLTYMVDGKEYKTISVKYGTTITPVSSPSKEGYSFSGWNGLPKTMPAYDVTVTGTFTINQYILTYIIDGKKYKSYEIDYNSVITPISAPVRKGMTFSGWANLPETMPAHDVTLSGTYSWSKKIQNNVIYQVTDTLNDYASVISYDEVIGDVVILSFIEIGGYNYTVNSIGNSAFYGCNELTSVNIPEGLTNIGNNAFYGCNNLHSVTLESNSIVSKSYSSNNTLKNIFGIQVQEYIIGDKVTNIGDYAFYDCSSLEALTLPDNIISIGSKVFTGRLLANKGTKTLLTIWNYNKKYPNYAYTAFCKSDEQELLPPAINVATTQTTATVKFDNVDLNDGFTYSYNNEPLKLKVIKHTLLKPESSHDITLVVSKDNVSYSLKDSYTTKGLNPSLNNQYEVTASSIRATGSYTEDDAKVVAQRMYFNGKAVEGDECYFSGLNPGRSYNVVYEIDVDYGGESLATYRTSKSIYTTSLQFSVAQPKVISLGNAIVSASANLDAEEENVGFEWRRTDWTNEFPSNTGKAYLYEGVIEGYIKNLNTDKLWKFRPYYLSDDGTYHYGDWMGLDPTNTSYFEPTVHTYAKINIEGNTALVRGYALAGTDNIKVQGFKYWKTSGNNAPNRAPSVPANAQTIEAVGQQIITATLAALEYNTTYHYVAFVTTEDGTTYYGEEQVFTTPMPPAGIDDVTVEAPSSVKKKGVYTLTGVKLADDKSELQGLPQGMYIIDGKKVMIK